MEVILRLAVLLMLCGAVEMGKRRNGRGRRRGGRERSSRGLVPQLMANYSGPEVTPAHEVSCSLASLACAQRDGCGSALSPCSPPSQTQREKERKKEDISRLHFRIFELLAVSNKE